MGDSTTTSSSTGTSASSPWAPQASQIQNAFGDAQNIYNQRTAQGPFTGNYYAPLSTGQNNAISQAQGYAGSTGQTLQGNDAALAAQLQGGSTSYLNNALNLSTGAGYGQQNPQYAGILSNAAAGTVNGVPGVNLGLSSALNQAGTAGAQSLAGYNAGLGSAISSAGTDSAPQLINDANQYMNSSQVQGQVANVNAQIGQTLHEQTLPGLNRQAAMGGNLNSSRTGAAEAQANEGAAIAEGNADSSIMNNAYNTGLATAAAQRTSGISQQLQGGESGLGLNTSLAQGEQGSQQQASQFGTNTALNAASTGLSSGLAYQGLGAQTSLAGNAQLGSGVGMGLASAQDAQSLAGGNYALASGSGGLQQAGSQAGLENAYQKWNMGNTYDQNALANYYGIVGANNWGGNTTSSQTGTQTQQQSPLSTALGVATGIGGLAMGNPMAALGGFGRLFGGSSGSSIGNPFGGSYGVAPATDSGSMWV